MFIVGNVYPTRDGGTVKCINDKLKHFQPISGVTDCPVMRPMSLLDDEQLTELMRAVFEGQPMEVWSFVDLTWKDLEPNTAIYGAHVYRQKPEEPPRTGTIELTENQHLQLIALMHGVVGFQWFKAKLNDTEFE